jgi:hypothetical protein
VVGEGRDETQTGVAPTGNVDDEPDYIIFKDDDEGFRDWTRQHPNGFYINTERKPSANYLMLHRVGCIHVGDAEDPDVSWTTDYIKVCSPIKMELEAWARTVVGGDPISCQTCFG